MTIRNFVYIFKRVFNDYKKYSLRYYYIQQETSRLARLLLIIGIIYALLIFVLLPYQYSIALQDYYIEIDRMNESDSTPSEIKLKLYSLVKEISNDYPNNQGLVSLKPVVNIVVPQLKNNDPLIIDRYKLRKVVMYDDSFIKNFNDPNKYKI